MRTIAEQEFKISTITLPTDFEAAKASPKVDEIKASIDQHGLLQRVGIEQSTSELIWGRKRLAAHLALGLSHVPAVVVSFDYPEEKEVVTLAENLDRQDLTADERALMRARVAELEEQRAIREREQADAAMWAEPDLTIERDPDFDDSGTERPLITGVSVKRPGAKSKGRAEAAAKLKTSVRQLNKDIRRAKELKGEIAPKEAEPAPPVLEMHGLSMDANELEKVREIQVALDGAAAAMRKAMGLVKPLGQLDNYPRDRFQKFYGEMKFIASLLKQGRPAWVCLDCKLIPALRAKCPRCMSSGFIVEEQIEEIPEELKRTGDAAGVFINGKFKTLKGLGR